MISPTARFAGSGAPVSFNYEKVGANSTQIFSGANTYTGTTTVSEGTLLVNGTHTFGGAYTVNGAVAGDYNQNAAVDTADYVLWRKTPASYGGDPDGYNTWRQNYGTGSGTLGGTGTISESVLVNPGGTLAPGVSIGTLTVDSGNRRQAARRLRR